MKKKERVVPKKNYFYLCIMIIVVVLITFGIFGLNDHYNNKKIETSYLSKYINEVSTKELSNVLSEPSTELFVFVTKTNDEDVYKMEKDLKKVIKKHDLRDNFILVDSMDQKNIKEINKVLESDIKVAPAIIYIKDGKFVKSIDSNESLLRSDELEKLLDEYEVN